MPGLERGLNAEQRSGILETQVLPLNGKENIGFCGKTLNLGILDDFGVNHCGLLITFLGVNTVSL